MEKDLRKRIEEAENDYIGHPFEVDEGTPISMSRQAFQAGAEWGYKEAIALAKEWLDYKVGGYLSLIREEGIIGSTFRTAQMLTDFESDMNKLWEEKK